MDYIICPYKLKVNSTDLTFIMLMHFLSQPCTSMTAPERNSRLSKSPIMRDCKASMYTTLLFPWKITTKWAYFPLTQLIMQLEHGH